MPSRECKVGRPLLSRLLSEDTNRALLQFRPVCRLRQHGSCLADSRMGSVLAMYLATRTSAATAQVV